MPAPAKINLDDIADALASGTLTSRSLVEGCLERIEAPDGEGSRAFISVDATGARAAADAMDGLRSAGHAPSPYAGIPIAIKDLADIQGQVTAAGSKVLSDASPACADAPVVARLRAAGLILIGRANMTEFAYSGLGINPHYGTPLSPWDRASKRVPGGSSSGSGVAVADGMALGALGTDTGGSCRIPAAFNGVVGYKPTARRVPTDSVVPLSTSLDSIGPLAPTVTCCHVLDAIMSARHSGGPLDATLDGMRLLVPETVVLEKLDAHVAADFEAALAKLSQAGARITRTLFKPFDLIPATLDKGGLSASESFHWHKDLIARRQNGYDQRVLARIMKGAEQSAADYIELLTQRQRAITAYEAAMVGFDAILSPTIPIVAPRIADCDAVADYNRNNMLVLRNTLMINVLDGCSLALPMHQRGAPPTSLMISGPALSDHRIMQVAAAAERALVT